MYLQFIGLPSNKFYQKTKQYGCIVSILLLKYLVKEVEQTSIFQHCLPVTI